MGVFKGPIGPHRANPSHTQSSSISDHPTIIRMDCSHDMPLQSTYTTPENPTINSNQVCINSKIADDYHNDLNEDQQTGNSREPLIRTLNEFLNLNYTKKELQDYCRKNNLDKPGVTRLNKDKLVEHLINLGNYPSVSMPQSIDQSPSLPSSINQNAKPNDHDNINIPDVEDTPSDSQDMNSTIDIISGHVASYIKSIQSYNSDTSPHSPPHSSPHINSINTYNPPFLNPSIIPPNKININHVSSQPHDLSAITHPLSVELNHTSPLSPYNSLNTLSSHNNNAHQTPSHNDLPMTSHPPTFPVSLSHLSRNPLIITLHINLIVTPHMYLITTLILIITLFLILIITLPIYLIETLPISLC